VDGIPATLFPPRYGQPAQKPCGNIDGPPVGLEKAATKQQHDHIHLSSREHLLIT
jgi:hypothetical protein